MQIPYDVKFTLNTEVQDRGSYWAVYLEEVGMTAYGRDEESALAKADQMVDDVMESFGDEPDPLAAFEEYMKSHDVKYTVEPVGRPEIVPEIRGRHVDSARRSRTLERRLEHAVSG